MIFSPHWWQHQFLPRTALLIWSSATPRGHTRVLQRGARAQLEVAFIGRLSEITKEPCLLFTSYKSVCEVIFKDLSLKHRNQFNWLYSLKLLYFAILFIYITKVIIFPTQTYQKAHKKKKRSIELEFVNTVATRAGIPSPTLCLVVDTARWKLWGGTKQAHLCHAVTLGPWRIQKRPCRAAFLRAGKQSLL